MADTIKKLYFNKLTFEDIEWGFGQVTQVRGGNLVTMNRVNLETLPINSTTTLLDLNNKVNLVVPALPAIEIVGTEPVKSAVLGAEANAIAATNSATASETSRQASDVSAVNAANSEANAANSEVNAANSATASETSRQASDAALYDFKGRYFQALATAPTVDLNGNQLNAGDMYFDTTLNEMRVYTGTLWQSAGSAGSTVNGTSQRQSFTATAGQTIFAIAGGYDPTFADVYLNGTKLLNGTDVDVSSGTDVVLSVVASAGDIVDVVAYGAFAVANTYTKAEIDAGTVILNGIKNVDGVGSGLDADTVDGVQGVLLGIGGAGYSFVNETANRVLGTTYSNTTGKPIQLVITLIHSGISGNSSLITIDGVSIGYATTVDIDSGRLAVQNIVIPNGSTYSVTGVNLAIDYWFELK